MDDETKKEQEGESAYNLTLTVAIVDYNVHDLTNAAVKAAVRHISHRWESFIVVDNSDDGTRFHCETSGITVIDNRDEQFCKVYRNGVYPSKAFYHILRTCYGGDQYHSCVIQKLFEVCTTDLLVLIDSDAILHSDLDFITKMENYVTACEYQFLRAIGERPFIRCLPVVQCLNVRKMKELGMNAYDGFYTGETLFFEIQQQRAEVLRIRCDDYAAHLWSGSWVRDRKDVVKFLECTRKLWDDTAEADEKNGKHEDTGNGDEKADAEVQQDNGFQNYETSEQ